MLLQQDPCFSIKFRSTHEPSTFDAQQTSCTHPHPYWAGCGLTWYTYSKETCEQHGEANKIGGGSQDVGHKAPAALNARCCVKPLILQHSQSQPLV